MGLHHRGHPVWSPELFGVEEEWLCSQLVTEGSQGHLESLPIREGHLESLLTREGVHEKEYTGLLVDRQDTEASVLDAVTFSQEGE